MAWTREPASQSSSDFGEGEWANGSPMVAGPGYLILVPGEAKRPPCATGGRQSKLPVALCPTCGAGGLPCGRWIDVREGKGQVAVPDRSGLDPQIDGIDRSFRSLVLALEKALLRIRLQCSGFLPRTHGMPECTESPPEDWEPTRPNRGSGEK